MPFKAIAAPTDQSKGAYSAASATSWVVGARWSFLTFGVCIIYSAGPLFLGISPSLSPKFLDVFFASRAITEPKVSLLEKR